MSEVRTRFDNKHDHLVELQKECVRRGERIQTLTRRMNSARLKVEEAQKELDGSAESERRQWQNRCASALPALTSTESGISGMALLTAHTHVVVARSENGMTVTASSLLTKMQPQSLP